MRALVVVLILFSLQGHATRPEGIEFLKAIAAEPDIVVLPTGLQYKVLQEGDQDAHSPDIVDTCLVHFRGTLMNGTEFVNSDRRHQSEIGVSVDPHDIAQKIKSLMAQKTRYVEREQYSAAQKLKQEIEALKRMKSTGSAARPVKVIPEKMIPGWKQALALMKPGDKWRLYLKSELGYSGASKHVDGIELIAPGEVLVFDLELVSFVEYHWWHTEGLHWWHILVLLTVLYYLFKHLLSLEPTHPSDATGPKLVRLKQFENSPENVRVFLEMRVGQDLLGRVELELFQSLAPKTCENFRALCTGEKGFGYKGSRLHRIITGFMCQGGDFTEHNGTGGRSIYGANFGDEFENGYLSHTDAGLLAMANSGPNTNGSQFFITTARCTHLDAKHVVFGRVVAGMHFVMTELDSNEGTPPSKPVEITDCGEVKSKST